MVSSRLRDRAYPGHIYIWGSPKIRGTFLEGSHKKDNNILGSILGSPHFVKLPYIYIYMLL